MRRGFLMLIVGVLSCGDPTAPDARLLGIWTTPLEDIGSGFDRSHVIRFHANGTMDDELRLYRYGQLSETFRLVYEYEVRGDSLFTRPAATLRQDALAYWTRFNRSRFDVIGERLTITYPWFGPVDEPITVTTVFLRNACLGAASMLCM